MGNVDEIDDFESNDEPVWAEADRLTSNSNSSNFNNHGAVATTSRSDRLFFCQHPMGPAYTFILPDLYQFADGFRQFLERDMIEMPTLRRLELSGHLNWWCVNHSQKLYPLVTTGDGNCLLHAASLGTWGVHDRQLHLRNLLYNVLKNGSRRHAFWRRWRWSESKANLQSGLVLNEEEWAKEWNDVLSMAAPTPRTSQVSESSGEGVKKSNSTEQIYESLETIHVFALAHILKRPIVVVSDTVLRNANGEELSPIPFGGIYLPLECPPEQCHRSPLVLCYDSSHFSALVAMRCPSSPYLTAIPIMDKNRNILPVHFAVDPSPDFTWWKDEEDQKIADKIDAKMTEDHRLDLIGRYMDVVKMDLRRGSIKKTLPVANSQDPLAIQNKLMTLASSGGGHIRDEFDDKNSGGRIMKEIRQHLRRLGRRNKKDKPSPRKFSATELRQTNCIFTALLHNFAHQYTDSMVDNYITVAKRRFEEMRTLSTSFTPKNRMSRSFSSSSVLLTCLNTHCDKTASPSTNFLCDACFEDQKREMASIGSSTSFINQSTSSSNGLTLEEASSSVGGGESTPRGLYATYRTQQTNANNGAANFTHHQKIDNNKKSNTMPSISSALKTNGPVTIASTDMYFDSEPDEFEEEDDEEEPPFHRGTMPLPRNGYLSNREVINGDGRKVMNVSVTMPKKSHAPPPLPPSKPKSFENPQVQPAAAVIRSNRTNIHITPGTVNCHNANSVSSNIATTKVSYQYATTKS